MSVPSLSLKDSIGALGLAAYNMSFSHFCQTLGLETDDYAISKYTAFKAIGTAMNSFSDSTLATLTTSYLDAQYTANKKETTA